MVVDVPRVSLARGASLIARLDRHGDLDSAA
jgi:hypothetical protein